MADEVKDTRSSERDYKSALARLEKSGAISKSDKKNIHQFLEDCALGRYSRKKVKIKRRLRYLNDLITLSDYFKKPWNSITVKDTTKWYLAMEHSKIKKKRGKNAYSAGGKNSFIETFRRFGKWFYRDNPKQYEKIFGWMKKFEENIEISALRAHEVEKLADSSDTRDKAIIMFLFDSGARASEFLNIRMNDLRKEEQYFKVRIRISKTKPRTIILPLASKSLEAWLKIHPDQNNPGAFLFPIEYDALRLMLRRKGKILGKRVYPHLFRHSSATFYANRYKNPYKLAYRYGWAMNSKEVQRYIDREGIEEEEIKGIVEQERIEHLQKENEKIKHDMAVLKEDHNQLYDLLKGLNLRAQGKHMR